MADDIPPGWAYNPSAWPQRLPGLLLALAGLGIATYLGLYQLRVLTTVWEPFFGAGSQHVLRESSIAHRLPIPDALLGAFLYLLEFVAEGVAGPGRWRTAPWAVVGLGLLAALMGLGGVFLAVAQPVLFGAFCTLCLASAACSILILFAVLGEVRAALGHLRRETAAGRSFWKALRGPARARAAR